jgi:Asp-tRNA(Asn)/Glu-tRNA(Gln) amidotransferase B subunit
MSEYEPAIGLEVHVQLRTRTKLFCADLNEFGAPPNTLVCPICLGLPGALPVTNSHAVTLAVRAAVGLGCTVHEVSTFERKNYAYPDLPKGYQITQYRQPLATGGHLDVPRRVALARRALPLQTPQCTPCGSGACTSKRMRAGSCTTVSLARPPWTTTGQAYPCWRS